MTDPAAPVTFRQPLDVQSVQVGGETVVFIDDFLADPQALVAAACAARFEPAAPPGEGKGYPGLRAPAPAPYTAAVSALVAPLVQANFSVPAERPMKVGLSAFSLATTAPEALGPWQRTPHFDASTPHPFAVLLYLCGPEHGGTGFYRHRATGLQRITADHRERYLDAWHAEVNARCPPARYFDHGDERFEFLGMLPARFNRLAVYPGSLLHSACLNPACSLSDDPRRGRLTVNTFYDF